MPFRLRDLFEPYVLLPIMALAIVGGVWRNTLNTVHKELAVAEAKAVQTAQRVVETYTAQALRALNEIDRSLKVVNYAYAKNAGQTSILAALRDTDLLLPSVVFTTRLVNAQGHVEESNRSSGLAMPVHPEMLARHRSGHDVWVGAPVRTAGSEEWTIDFSRNLTDRSRAGASFTHAAVVTVNPEYFVSIYDNGLLGDQGVLAIVGSDGLVRARRTGERVSAGDTVRFTEAAPNVDDPDAAARLQPTPWDGVPRYTAARNLLGFPLAVVVGLSEQEQLREVNEARQRHMRQATIASAIVLAVAALLTWMSWRMTILRRRQVHDQLAHAKQVEYMAFHDGLTQLANRSSFSRTVQNTLAAAKNGGPAPAVMLMDLDGFKKINDLLGHHAGDDLLKDTAQRLIKCVGDAGLVARLGGDEFAVMLHNVTHEFQAAGIAQRIVESVSQPYWLIGQECRVTASIGICVFPQGGQDEETLTKHADTAMYHAKERGKNNFQFYTEAMNTRALERMAFEAGLRNALEKNELKLLYQAKRDTESGRVTGAEALLRWQHPDLGVLMPKQFINVAEDTGLIVPIGRWILSTACEDNRSWQNDGSEPIAVAINLTSRQFFDPALVNDVESVLRRTGMPGRLLELEISEATLMRDIPRAIDVLGKLRSIGVRTAIDQFGVSYLSLSTLRQFPVDILKIDQALVHNTDGTDAERELTRSIVSMGRSLSLKVVAQGVENQTQMAELRRQAFAEVQGFYFSHPLSAGDFAQSLDSTETA